MATQLDLDAILRTIDARLRRIMPTTDEALAYVQELNVWRRTVMVAAGDPAAFDDAPVRAWLKAVDWHPFEGPRAAAEPTPQTVAAGSIPSGENVPPLGQ